MNHAMPLDQIDWTLYSSKSITVVL